MTDLTLRGHCLSFFVIASIFSSSVCTAESDLFKPQQVHGTVFGLEAVMGESCAAIVVLRSAKERVEQFGELRRNSPKVAEFFNLSTWTMKTVDKVERTPLFKVSPKLGLMYPRTPSFIVNPVHPLPEDAGLGIREPTPVRLRKEIGTVKSGPYAGRAEMIVTRTNGTSVAAEFKNLTRDEVLQVMTTVDDHYLTQKNLTREQVDRHDIYDSFFPGRTIFATIRNADNNQEIFQTPRRELFHATDLPTATTYNVRITAPAQEIWDTSGVWGGIPGKTYINNQETNAVLLMEFLTDLLNPQT